mgnify:CR=1 FL=1
MTVYELMQQLQDCDRPDAEVRLVVEVEVEGDVRAEYIHPAIKEVFYSSLVSNTVVVSASEAK